jgi:hypothetical protein
MGRPGVDLVDQVDINNGASILQEILHIEALTCSEDQLPRPVILCQFECGPGSSRDLAKCLFQELLCGCHLTKATSRPTGAALSQHPHVEKRHRTAPSVDPLSVNGHWAAWGYR